MAGGMGAGGTDGVEEIVDGHHAALDEGVVLLKLLSERLHDGLRLKRTRGIRRTHWCVVTAMNAPGCTRGGGCWSWDRCRSESDVSLEAQHHARAEQRFGERDATGDDREILCEGGAEESEGVATSG